jgi:hypothetical protein
MAGQAVKDFTVEAQEIPNGSCVSKVQTLPKELTARSANLVVTITADKKWDKRFKANA